MDNNHEASIQLNVLTHTSIHAQKGRSLSLRTNLSGQARKKASKMQTSPANRRRIRWKVVFLPISRALNSLLCQGDLLASGKMMVPSF